MAKENINLDNEKMKKISGGSNLFQESQKLGGNHQEIIDYFKKHPELFQASPLKNK